MISLGSPQRGAGHHVFLWEASDAEQVLDLEVLGDFLLLRDF